MRGEAGKVVLRLALGHSPFLRVVTIWQTPEGEEAPIANQDEQQRGELRLQRPAPEQEQKDVAQANLRKRVDQRPIERLKALRAEEHAEQDQDDCPAERMKQHARVRLSLRLSLGGGEWQRDAHHERERRLDQIPQAASSPGSMLELIDQQFPEAAFGKFLGDTQPVIGV